MQFRRHIVRNGESLSTIAQRELGSTGLWPQLFAFNAAPGGRTRPPLQDPNRLQVGQQLAIPPRVSSRPHYLVRHSNLRHPLQQTRPQVALTTAPAAPVVAPTQQVAPAAPAMPLATSAALGQVTPTLVNSPAFKFDLDLAPPIKRHTPVFDYEVKFQGQIILWTDQQVDILTFTNKGIESAAKLRSAISSPAC